MNNDIYIQGLHSFQESPDDNPDCVPFYRAWAGMTAVLGKPTMDQWHWPLHEAICWGANKPESEQYETIVKSARWIIDRWTRPEEPRHSYSWECAPSEPTEEDAHKFFNSEFKHAFPHLRANSKYANEQWKEKHEQALSILRERYQAELIQYQAREAKRDAENARRREEWIDKFWGMALFENLIRKLEATS